MSMLRGQNIINEKIFLSKKTRKRMPKTFAL